jgi:hypothetical protein
MINRPQFLLRSRVLLLHICRRRIQIRLRAIFPSALPIRAFGNPLRAVGPQVVFRLQPCAPSLSLFWPFFARQRNPFLQRPPGLYFQFCTPLLDHRYSGMYVIQSLAHRFLRLRHSSPPFQMNLLLTAPQRQLLPVVSGYREMTASHLSCILDRPHKNARLPLPTACPFYLTSESPSNGMRGAKGKARGQRLATTRVFTIAQRDGLQRL